MEDTTILGKDGHWKFTHSFFGFTTTRPVAILMVFIGISVFGWISYRQLPMNLMPEISYPSLTIRTEYPGAAPQEVENSISRPLEQTLGVVGNLVSISSISRAGQSDVKLEFTWNTDMNLATSEVREKIDQVYLPEDAKRPLLLRYDPSLDPIMRLGIYGEASLIYLRYLAEEKIKRILETVEGVAAVKVKGGLEEEIRIEIQEKKLTMIGINIQQVKNRLAQENINLAGGNLKEGETEYLVRTLNEFKTVEEIAEIVIGTWNGKNIKIRDIAEIKRDSKDREIITSISGKESVEIEIYKEADVNIITVAGRIKACLFGTAEQQDFVKTLHSSAIQQQNLKQKGQEEKGKTEKDRDLRKHRTRDFQEEDSLHRKRMTSFVSYNLPPGIHIDILSDPSVFIQNAIAEVKSTALVGGILAILVLFIFLRSIPSTLIIGLSIPISIVATFGAMKMFHVSLNIMSLGGLALGIGMLVDNSIVVLESIVRCREEGDNLIPATIRGVGEVGGAVFSSTLTTVAVFFPIVFVQGIAGQIFGSMALTVVFSLITSLAVALFLIPMLYSRQGVLHSWNSEKSPFPSLFSFSTESYWKISRQNPRPLPDQMMLAFVSIPYTLILILWKIGKIALVLLIFFFQSLLLILAILCLPLFFLLRLGHIIHFSYRTRLMEIAESSSLGKSRFVQDIWPNFLVHSSVLEFLENVEKIGKRLGTGGILQRLLYLPLMPLEFVLTIVKGILHFFFEFLFRILHAAFLIIGVVVRGLWMVIRALTFLPIKIFFGLFHFFYRGVEISYQWSLRFALENRILIITMVTGAFLYCILVPAQRLGKELIPALHQGEFHIEVYLPIGTPVEKTNMALKEIIQYLAVHPSIARVASVAGTDKSDSSKEEQGEHTARITVTMKRTARIVPEEKKLIADIRSHIGNYSGLEWKISPPVLFTFKTPVEVEIQGYNLEKLQDIARTVQQKIANIPGIYDVKSNIKRGNPEVQIVYNRRLMAHYKLNVMDVATIVRNKIRGDIATRFKDEDRKIDILVRLREEDRLSIAQLKRIIVNPGGSKPIDLDTIADIKITEGPAEILRIDQQRTALITANIAGRDLQSVSEDIYRELRNMEMPRDFSYRLTGQNKEMETSLKSLQKALFLAIFLVYIVMASQFESLIHPFVIIFTVPLALIGVIFTLDYLQIPLSIVFFLGLITLAGIVVNNAIVLVDYINQLRERGMSKNEAILQAGKVRLRPILMTTSTTVLGLLPMALGWGDGSEIRIPMAITIISGLLSSTILTLVVIPTAYSLVDVNTRH